MDNSRFKFRAWDTIAKDMVYFGLGQNHFNTYCMEDNEVYTLDLDDNPPVMQFTGLTDKNGEEIYEGDILKRKDHNSVVKFYKGMFIATPNKTKMYDYILSGEVIGNIYQHPELLGE